MTLLLWKMLHFILNINLKFFFSTISTSGLHSSFSYDFLLDYSVSSYSHPFNQMPFESMSGPTLHPLMVNPYLNTRDAFGGDMVFNDAPFLLAP